MMKHNYHWINKEKSRYYKVIIYKDMLNDWIITSIWGGINSRLGNYKHMVMSDTNKINNFISTMNTRRVKRGYVLLND